MERCVQSANGTITCMYRSENPLTKVRHGGGICDVVGARHGDVLRAAPEQGVCCEVAHLVDLPGQVATCRVVHQRLQQVVCAPPAAIQTLGFPVSACRPCCDCPASHVSGVPVACSRVTQPLYGKPFLGSIIQLCSQMLGVKLLNGCMPHTIGRGAVVRSSSWPGGTSMMTLPGASQPAGRKSRAHWMVDMVSEVALAWL